MSQSQDPIWWQTANRKWALHGHNYPTEQMKVSRQKVSDILIVCFKLTFFVRVSYKWNVCIENCLE